MLQAYASPIPSCHKTAQVQSCKSPESSRMFIERDDQGPSTMSQHLSAEAIIGIVALVAAVLVVPFISKYFSCWITQRYLRASAGQINSTAQGQYTVQGTLPRPPTDIEANFPRDTDRSLLVPITVTQDEIYELEDTSIFLETVTH
ncbi:hypothetical protein GGR51DRAFT_577015 [Nemania sp. FL0031]|nr:hypothetical protein GGR51DRAFT_577015 [Nemania sp. FL0031]